MKKAPRNTRALITIEGECHRPQGFTFHDLDIVHEDYQIKDMAKIDERLKGQGVRLRGLIDQVGPGFYTKYLTVESEDGKFSACLPLEEISRTAVIIYGIKGKPLDREDGGPVRFVIPFYPDKCANVKGATRIVLSEKPGKDTRPTTPAEHAKIHADD